MFSQTNDYALRVMVHLARHSGKMQTSPEIAAAAGIPHSYLSKVLQILGRAGFITAQRGLHGGFVLAREASQITTSQIVAAVDPLKHIHSCSLKLAAHGTNLCTLHRRIDNALAEVEVLLRQTTLAELVGGETSPPSPLRPGTEPRATSLLII